MNGNNYTKKLLELLEIVITILVLSCWGVLLFIFVLVVIGVFLINACTVHIFDRFKLENS